MNEILEMMNSFYEIKEDVYNEYVEENRQDVIQFATEVVQNILKGEEVDNAVVEESASKWFELHKNHVEEFAEELMEYAEMLEKAIKRNKSKWIKK